MGTIHTEHFRIRTSEINHLRLLHPHALIQLMQEASMQHTISMKVSYWDLEAMKASWVLLKMDVKIYKCPKLNETIRIETYPSGLDGYFTYRDYQMYDEDGQICATISSMWTLMHLEQRKMIKIPDHFSSLVYKEKEALPKPDFRLRSCSTLSFLSEMKVHYFHLDWNGHVNNVQLVRLMLESMESNIYQEFDLTKLKLNFKAEAILDQVIIIENEQVTETLRRHCIKDKDTSKELLFAESEWSKKY